MNYEALLSKIDTLEARYTDYPTYLALQEVVQLHKPSENDSWGSVVCVTCPTYEYPCLTIQSIEKELNHGV